MCDSWIVSRVGSNPAIVALPNAISSKVNKVGVPCRAVRSVLPVSAVINAYRYHSVKAPL